MAGLIEQLVARESTSCTSPGEREGHWKWVAHLTFYHREAFKIVQKERSFHFLTKIVFRLGINFFAEVIVRASATF